MANIIGGVRVTGFISPTDSEDDYPVIDPLYGIDGLRNVTSIKELKNITYKRRRAGMLVGVQDVDKYYKLLNKPWDGTINDWEEISFGTSSISGSTDSNIVNPQDGDYLIYSGGTVINLSQIVMTFSVDAGENDVLVTVPDIFPAKKKNSMFFVNGVKQIYGLDYKIINNSGDYDVVWITSKYLIDNDDSLEIIYN